MHHEIRFSEELMDAEITDNGKLQCYEAGKNLKDKINLKYVIVSPLKRCLQTTDNLLQSMSQNNAHFRKPEVIVHPLIFEKIEDSCDWLFDAKKNMAAFPHFNWSLFTSIEHLPIYQFQYCDNTLPEKLPTNYYQTSLDFYKKSKNYYQTKILLSAMQELAHHNLYIESSKKTIKRLQILKEYINSLINENEHTFNPEEKILLVGHSILFKHLTSKYIDGLTFEPSAKENVLNNCEAVSLSFI